MSRISFNRAAFLIPPYLKFTFWTLLQLDSRECQATVKFLKPLIKTLFSTILFIKYASKGPDQCSNHFIDIIFWENWQRNINSNYWYLRTACHLHCVHIQNCSHICKFQQGSCRRHFYIFLAFQHTHWYLKLTRRLFIRKRRNLC